MKKFLFFFLFINLQNAFGLTLQEQASSLARQLKCPVCQGQSIEDSEAPVALALKKVIITLLKKGYSEEQIIALFKERYGEDISFMPSEKVLGVLPSVFLIAFALFLLRWTYRSQKT